MKKRIHLGSKAFRAPWFYRSLSQTDNWETMKQNTQYIPYAVGELIHLCMKHLLNQLPRLHLRSVTKI